ncbi:MAG: prepilin-type N-terminal cleavage/methylation domain-containing protein [Devosia nanyangense]|uniref:Prepilin-type N-terminal cleavage/methylation domain-containing protein n=1 Tax=Devosia nanyangense TaxID=1228055 RepID=A0A933L5P5_9HYPH|nr:prepilin-type N-terminal cleavage/methylation domain-containing protein [Devosia nanyangense]
MSGASADAGFSILEVLVALAIASLVTMAIGGLFVLASTVHGRVDEAERVETALLDVQGLLRIASDAVDLMIARPAADGFALVDANPGAGASPGNDQNLSLRSKRAELARPDSAAAADLSIFEKASLEYLTVAAEGAVWKSAETLGGGKPVAVRFRLQLHARVWRPLIWIASSLDVGR